MPSVRMVEEQPQGNLAQQRAQPTLHLAQRRGLAQPRSMLQASYDLRIMVIHRFRVPAALQPKITTVMLVSVPPRLDRGVVSVTFCCDPLAGPMPILVRPIFLTALVFPQQVGTRPDVLFDFLIRFGHLVFLSVVPRQTMVSRVWRGRLSRL
jgi:hypothetical protein